MQVEFDLDMRRTTKFCIHENFNSYPENNEIVK